MSMPDQDTVGRPTTDGRDYDPLATAGGVGTAMSTIDVALNRLLVAVNQHEERLTRVLTPDSSATPAGANIVDPTKEISGLAVNLQAIETQINGLAHRLEEITQRVDL